ncbi:unnamed protein product [Pleuronectes platessa]|uniref:Uncharacterized protein n=1 Tax=Pleuronectes platessa TaxID=8262 RepID=A0A9N7Y5P6_PLEPL|nr:unnamed protein product [Pleuronectes platessa]
MEGKLHVKTKRKRKTSGRRAYLVGSRYMRRSGLHHHVVRLFINDGAPGGGGDPGSVTPLTGGNVQCCVAGGRARLHRLTHPDELPGLKTWLRPNVQQMYGSEVPTFCCRGESTRMRRE